MVSEWLYRPFYSGVLSFYSGVLSQAFDLE